MTPATIVIVGGIRPRDPWHGFEHQTESLGVAARVVRFVYPEQWDGYDALRSPERVAEVVAKLAQLLEDESSRSDGLVLVGHSEGGLLVQKVLLGPAGHLVPRVRLVMLFATPVGETLAKRLVPWFARLLLPIPHLSVEPREWEELLRRTNLEAVSVLGAQDSVVTPAGHWDRSNTYYVPGDHYSIVNEGEASELLARILVARLPELSTSS